MHVARNGQFWQGRYTVGGRVFRVGLGRHPSRDAAMQCLVETAAKRGVAYDGKQAVEGKITLANWLTMYLASRSDLAAQTLAHNKHDCEEFAAFVGEHTPLADVGRQHARAWAMSLKRAGKKTLSASTIIHKIKRVRTCFRYAIDRDPPFIERNPFYGDLEKDAGFGRAGGESSDWRYVPNDEFDRMIAEMPSHEVRTLAMLARHAGLRLSEALSLRWNDINLDPKVSRLVVRVRGNHGRFDAGTKQAERDVPVSARLRQWLADVLVSSRDGSKGPCFGPSVDEIRKQFAAARESAGVERYGKPLHALRKSLITDWMDVPGLSRDQVSAWVGASVEVIIRHYYERFPARRMQAIITSDPTLGQTPQYEEKFVCPIDSNRNM